MTARCSATARTTRRPRVSRRNSTGRPGPARSAACSARSRCATTTAPAAAFDAGVMCPSYRATRDEQHLTRGRANTLRLALTGQLGAGRDGLGRAGRGDGTVRVLQGVPARVPDRRRHGEDEDRGAGGARGPPRRGAARARWWPRCRASPPLAGLVPAAGQRRCSALAAPHLGFAAGRTLPAFRGDAFRDAEAAGHAATSCLLADCFNRYFEPENLRAALQGAARRRAFARGAARRRPAAVLRADLSRRRHGGARPRRGAPHAGRAGRRPARGRAGAVLPVHPERRVPLAAARRERARDLAGRVVAARRVPRASRTSAVPRRSPRTAHVHGHCHQKSFRRVRPRARHAAR